MFYDSPELFPPQSSNNGSSNSTNGFPNRISSGSSNSSISSFNAPAEVLRGTSASLPPFSFQRQEVQHEERYEEEAGSFALARWLQAPMEERRKIPGCGINHLARFYEDDPVRAETSPVRMEEIFGPQVRTYARPRPQQQQRPTWMQCTLLMQERRQRLQQRKQHASSGISALLQSDESVLQQQDKERQRRFVRDPRYPGLTRPLSPLSSSSSSSSSSADLSLSLSRFRPINESTPLKRAPRSIIDRQHGNQYIPSFNVLPPEGYHTPSTSVTNYEETPQRAPPAPSKRGGIVPSFGCTHTVARNPASSTRTRPSGSHSDPAYSGSRPSTSNSRRRLDFGATHSTYP